MKQIWIVAVGLALLMTPAEASAAPTQASDFAQGPSDVAYQTAVRRLKLGQNVRVTTDSTRFEIGWIGATRDGVPYHNFDDESGTTFASGPSDSTVTRWSEIRRVDVRGRATSTGWPIGLVMGALGGVAVGVGLSQMTLLGGEPTSGDVETAALYCGVAGAIGGSLVGAIIGTAFPKWHTIYKAKEARR